MTRASWRRGANVSPEHALALLGELPYGIAIFRAESKDPLDLRLVYANAEASQLLGVDLEALCGKTVREAFPTGLLGDGSNGAARMYQRVAEGGARERMSGVRYADGAKGAGWFDVLAIPLGERQVAVLHDNLGERQLKEREVRDLNLELERSLTAGERRYRSIFGSAPVGLWETDLSRVKAMLDGILADGHSPELHLRGNPELQAEAARLWTIREANAAARPLLDCREGELPLSFGEIVRGASEGAWLSVPARRRSRLTVVRVGAVRARARWRPPSLAVADPSERAGRSRPRGREHAQRHRAQTPRARAVGRRRAWRRSAGSRAASRTTSTTSSRSSAATPSSSCDERSPDGDPTRERRSRDREAARPRGAALTRQLLAFSRRQVLEPRVARPQRRRSRARAACCAALIGEDIELVDRRSAPDVGRVRADRGQIEQVLVNLVRQRPRRDAERRRARRSRPRTSTLDGPRTRHAATSPPGALRRASR